MRWVFVRQFQPLRIFPSLPTMLLDSDAAKEMHETILALRKKYRLCSQRLERLHAMGAQSRAPKIAEPSIESGSEDQLRSVRFLALTSFLPKFIKGV